MTFNHTTYPFGSPDCMRVEGTRAVLFWNQDPDGSGPFTAGRITVHDGGGMAPDTFYVYGYEGDRCNSLTDMGVGGVVGGGDVVVEDPFPASKPPSRRCRRRRRRWRRSSLGVRVGR